MDKQEKAKPKSYTRYGGVPCGICGLGVDFLHADSIHGYPPGKTRREWMHGECWREATATGGAAKGE